MALKNVMHVEGGNIHGATPNSDNMISDAYNPENVYDAGDICIYGDGLYKCNTDDTTGVWNASKWGKTTIAEEMKALMTMPPVMNTGKTLLFNQTIVGDGTSQNLASSNYIVPEDGFYAVFAQLSAVSATPSNSNVFYAMVDNGSTFIFDIDYSNTNYANVNFQARSILGTGYFYGFFKKGQILRGNSGHNGLAMPTTVNLSFQVYGGK